MRIRKHATILLVYNHVCQLNQSPWDVISFPNEDPSLFQPPPPSSNYQFDGYDDNGTFNNSKETVASNNVTKDVDVDVSVEKIKQNKDEDIKMEDLGLLMDQTNNRKKKQEKQNEVVMAETESPRRHPIRAKKSSYSSFNPYEFYYYSGFGPLWGKKRGASGKTNHPATSIAGNNSTKDVEQCSSFQVDNEEFDYVELAYEDDHHEEENEKKKRPRKH